MLSLRQRYTGCVRRCLYVGYRRGLVHLGRVCQYHVPLVELGISTGHPLSAGKGQSSVVKWQLIESTLPSNVKLALDIGCNNGFFSLRLASKGIFTVVAYRGRALPESEAKRIPGRIHRAASRATSHREQPGSVGRFQRKGQRMDKHRS